jgi:hypothetical protein
MLEAADEIRKKPAENQGVLARSPGGGSEK